jgi:hypothetical protein
MKYPHFRFGKLLGLALASLVLVIIACNQPSILDVSKTDQSITQAAAASTKPIGRSLFGMHIGNPETIPWPAVPIATWRLWDVGGRGGLLVFWAHLERQKGQWDFTTLDQCVELAQSRGVEILYTLGITPKWASARPNDGSAYGDGPTAAEPKNLDDWRDYVRTVATRYKGKIRYYEIWNEPNLKNFFSGTPEQMVALAREAYKILKEVDPSIQVVSPSVLTDFGGWGWLDEYLSKGGSAYTDIVGAHFYIHDKGSPEDSLQLVREVQRVMEKHNLSQKPLWNTETGFGNKQENSYLSDEQSMAYVARSYILNWAVGIERFYWYGWDTRNVVTLLMVKEDNKTLTPAAQAYSEVQKWLVGSRMNKCEPDSNNTWTCDLTRENGDPIWIVWNSKQEQDFKVPENWNVGQVQNLKGEKTSVSGDRMLKIGQLPLLLSKA